MTPDPQRERVLQLFDAAVDQPAGERNGFLRRACEGDDALLAEVTSLIAEFERLGNSGEVALSADRQDRREAARGVTENIKQIGRYVVTRELGRGAMGIVYEARDPLIGRTVAIKTIRLDEFGAVSEKQWLQERLFREARSAGALSHPGIVTIHDIGLHEDLAFIAMEYVDGPTLESLMRDQLLDHAAIVDILGQAATALDFANESGVVHRDVKPGNIMLHKGRTVKITDFGIAKITSTQQLTRTGTVMGTPSYMSPEQIRALPVDGRSDQFSLGVIAFEMLTGVKAFRADSLPPLVHQIVYEDRPSAQAINSSLSGDVDTVLHRVLAKAAEDRFRNCAEMVEALSEALKKSGAEAEERRRQEEWAKKLESGVQEVERLVESSEWQAADSRVNLLRFEFEGEPQLLALADRIDQTKRDARMLERFDEPIRESTLESSRGLRGSQRMQAIFMIGILAAIAHAVLWALSERLFGWNFGGGGASLPQGLSAVVLSLTMTIPLIVVPALYERLFHTGIVCPGHWLGGALILVFSAFGHLILYGSKTVQFVGLRNLIFPLDASVWYRALPMELIYAVVHFSSIVLLYRVVVGAHSGPLTIRALLPAFIACAIWLSAVSIMIFLKYPDSLVDQKWIEVRGVLNAIILMITMAGGMLM